MIANFDLWLTFAIGLSETEPGGEEGGMSLDTGVNNPTWRGIALDEWQRWREDESLNGGDMQRMLWRTEIGKLTLANYWAPIRGDTLPAGADVLVMDHCFNAGQGSVDACVRAWQTRLDVTPDGIVGAVTTLAMRGAGTATALGWLRDCIEVDYRTKRQFPEDGADWLARLRRCTTLAKQLAGVPATTGDNA